MSILFLFIIIQIILLFFMALHDFINVPPFTNIKELEKAHSVKERLIMAIINSAIVLIPLLITLYYSNKVFPFWAMLQIVIFYGLLTLGTILSWWVLYIFGS